MRFRTSWTRLFQLRQRIWVWASVWTVLVAFYLVTHWTGLLRWDTISLLPVDRYPPSPAFTRVKNSDTYLYSALVNMAPSGASGDVTSSFVKDGVGAANSIPGGGTREELVTETPYDEEQKKIESVKFIVNDLDQDFEIVVTSLDRSRAGASSFVCCLQMEGAGGNDDTDNVGSGHFGEDWVIDRASLVTVLAGTYFEFVKPLTWSRWLMEYWLALTPSIYVATQFSCRIPKNILQTSELKPGWITLAPMPSYLARVLSPFLFLSRPWRSYQTYCPKEKSDYLPVEYPRLAPRDLALCSKVNHDGGGAIRRGPDPEVLTEWFEVQRHLGVDRVVVYDMGNNSPQLSRLFQYYEKLGVLELVAYSLPGEPRSRSLGEDFKHSAQFVQDETLAVLECRVRTSGYGLVLSIDKDEVLVPRAEVDLKILLRSLFQNNPTAAALNFKTQFFITSWAPSNPEEELLTLRYRQTRVARWECWKYAFLPARVKAAVTHEVFHQPGYTTEWIPSTEATLHHYRSCPKDTWGTCHVTSTMDHVMTRYKTELSRRVKVAREGINAEVLEDGEPAVLEEELADGDRRR